MAKVGLSFYEVLGTHRGASAEDIQQAWKSLSRVAHPDANVGASAEKLLVFQSTFVALSEAHSVLSDPNLRQVYNLRCDVTGDPCDHCHARGYLSKSRSFTEVARVPCFKCRATGRILRSRVQFPEKRVGGAL